MIKKMLQSCNQKNTHEISLNESTKNSIKKIVTSANTILDKDSLRCEFDKENKNDVYTLSLFLNQTFQINGVILKLRLEEWEYINYLAIGFVSNKEFKHIKIKNVLQGKKTIYEFSTLDLIYKIQNKYLQGEVSKADEIKIFIKGAKKINSALVLSDIVLFRQENLYTYNLNINQRNYKFEEFVNFFDYRMFQNDKFESIAKILHDYDVKSNPEFKKCSKFYMDGLGLASAKHEKTFIGVFDEPYEFISHNNTLRYSLHALDQVNTLMMEYNETQNIALYCAARDLVQEWIINNYEKESIDFKYAWYDHGVSERNLVFIKLLLISIKIGADKKFIAKLIFIIIEHAKLLSNEAFYAANQNTRYHNHALFQDIGLLLTSQILSFFDISEYWFKKSVKRISGQFQKLVAIDDDYGVIVENSPGYHLGAIKILEFIVEVLRVGKKNNITEEFEKFLGQMNNFKKVIRLGYNCTPSIGDTFRKAEQNKKRNTTKSQITNFAVMKNAGFIVLDKKYDTSQLKFIFIGSSLVKTHKHQDNLSFTLFFDGIEWLIDPSFYSHQYEDPIPKHLRSVYAHNNIAIKDMEYSIEPGTARIDAREDIEKYIIQGSHTCYKDIEIKRKVEISKNNLDINIYDDIQSTEKNIESYSLLQIGENIDVTQKDNKIFLTHPNSEYKLCIDYFGLETNIIEGFKEGRTFQGIIGHGFMQMADGKCLVTNVSDNSSCNIRFIKVVNE